MRTSLILVSVVSFSSCFNPFQKWPFTCQAPLTEGVACEEDSDCEEALICHPVEKVCAQRFSRGAECSQSTQCAPGLACTTNPDKFVCFQKQCDAQGQNCSVGNATGNKCPDRQTCPNDELCMLDVMSPSGYCQPPAQAAQSCEDYVDGVSCAAGLSCLTNNRCGSTPTQGQPCPRGTDRCSDGLICFFQDDGTNTCEMPRAIGQRCTAGGQCVKGAHCDLSRLVCTKNRNVGDSCQNGNECGEAPFDQQIGIDCVRGRCVDTSREGAECWRNRPSQCTSGRVCRRTLP